MLMSPDGWEIREGAIRSDTVDGKKKNKKRLRREQLTELFNSQVAILKVRGVSEETTQALERQLEYVITRSLSDERPVGPALEGLIPFLPVIPREILSLSSQLEMIENEGKRGGLCPSMLRKLGRTCNLQETPFTPYYIFLVDDGRSALDMTPQGVFLRPYEVQRIVEQRNYCSLTLEEGFAVGLHTDAFGRHDLMLTGSYYPNEVPLLSRYDGRPMKYGLHWLPELTEGSIDRNDGRPEVDWAWRRRTRTSIERMRGAPSCGMRGSG